MPFTHRTKGEYWGKQEHTFNDKLETIRQELLIMRAKG